MTIVETPEMVRAPVVVKVPVRLGNVEKSYTPVMVTGVGLAANEEGTQPIVNKAIIHTTIAEVKNLLCRIISLLFCLVNWLRSVEYEIVQTDNQLEIPDSFGANIFQIDFYKSFSVSCVWTT